MKIFILTLAIFVLGFESANGDDHDSHDHGKEEAAHQHEKAAGDKGHKEKHDDHGENEEGHAHGEKDEHGEGEEEENSAVGADKGILEKGENGFKLSPDAIKTFELRTQVITNKVLDIPRAALVEIKNDKFVYRIRDGWIKKVAVKIFKKDTLKFTVELSQHKDGDQIAINAVGFIRTAEMVAEEGVAHGHSH